MAFLTFAEAKVVAPPIVPMNKLVTFSKLKWGLSLGVVNNDESSAETVTKW